MLSLADVVEAIREYPVKPECPVTVDILSANAGKLVPQIAAAQVADGAAFQLERYKTIGEMVRKQISGHLAGQRHSTNVDFASLLDEKFGISRDPDEQRARIEKAAALKELAESRIGVLVGPAGAGKTTVLGILCDQPGINADGILLLAPTGKARVRMQELVGTRTGEAVVDT